MARVMRDTTVEATASKIFAACGPSWLEDSYLHWLAAVRAWSVGATRPLHADDRLAIVCAIHKLDVAEMERKAAELDILQGVRWVKHSWDRSRDRLVTEYATGRRPSDCDWYREGSIDEIEAKENAGQRELF